MTAIDILRPIDHKARGTTKEKADEILHLPEA